MSTNGYISLWQENSNNATDSDDSADDVPSFPPDTNISRPLLAVYWVDSSTRLDNDTTHGMVHYTLFTENSTQNNASRYLPQVSAKVSKVMKTNFTARWAFVVFWESLTYSGGHIDSRVNMDVIFVHTNYNNVVINFFARLFPHVPSAGGVS